MDKIAKFEKVSFEQYRKDWYKLKPYYITEDEFEDFIQDCYESIELPKRATRLSAGYDFYAPFLIELEPNQSITIPTGIRCWMEEGWSLDFYPRSGLGFKYGMRLANTVGIIDGDYYYADNEGHIHIKLVNDSALATSIEIGFNTAFCQAKFAPYGITVDDTTEGERKGGFGSTDKK